MVPCIITWVIKFVCSTLSNNNLNFSQALISCYASNSPTAHQVASVFACSFTVESDIFLGGFVKPPYSLRKMGPELVWE